MIAMTTSLAQRCSGLLYFCTSVVLPGSLLARVRVAGGVALLSINFTTASVPSYRWKGILPTATGVGGRISIVMAIL